MDFTFYTEKPVTKLELESFRVFKRSVKSNLKIGKLRVEEKFKNYSFKLLNCTAAEKENILVFLKSEKHSIKVTLKILSEF